ncbi:MAG: nucleoside deaminase [Bacteroidota bacterium]|nr:nucleoside deaminase [Bacteroidota bacterium]
MNEFMSVAINEAQNGMYKNEGGPFGAVIVKDGKIISVAHNEVLSSNDPTAHAEIIAIRKASKKLNNFDLSDCEIYSTAEPCPMCLAAIHWARLKKLYFGTNQKDATRIGFDDEKFYEIIKDKQKSSLIITKDVERDKCLSLFDYWQNKEDKTNY